MSDLINREAVIDIIQKEMESVTDYLQHDVLIDVEFKVDELPTVEAKEVVRAKWIKKDDTICYWYECSNCCSRILKNRFGKDVYSNFCPQCGCDMRTSAE